MSEHEGSEEGGEGLSARAEATSGWRRTVVQQQSRAIRAEQERDRLLELFEQMTGMNGGAPACRHLARAESAEAARDTALREKADAEARLAAVEAAINCPHGPRHYYAVDATCQRCELPSWVEALIRAALANPSAAQREHIDTDPRCSRHVTPTTHDEQVRFDEGRGRTCPACEREYDDAQISRGMRDDVEHPGLRIPGPDGRWMTDADPAQREAEVGARALREAADVWDEAVRAVAGVDPNAIHNPYRYGAES